MSESKREVFVCDANALQVTAILNLDHSQGGQVGKSNIELFIINAAGQLRQSTLILLLCEGDNFIIILWRSC